MTADALPDTLLDWLRTTFDDPTLAILRDEKLAGGAIQENVALDVGREGGARVEALVLRTDAPSGVAVSRSRAEEHALLAAAFDAGVRVPEPLGLCTDPAVLGRPFFLMRRVRGTTHPVRLTRGDELASTARDPLVEALGAELARIHAVPLDDPRLRFLHDTELERDDVERAVGSRIAAGRGLDGEEDPSAGHDFVRMPPARTPPARMPPARMPPARMPLARSVARYRRLLAGLGARRPVLELALAWLDGQTLDASAPVLCHHDFRTGNLMIDTGDGVPDGARVAGVLDWEFAAIGDPHEDIGWFCAPCWRFASRAREAGGIGSREAFYAGYERASGRTIDRTAVAVWEVVATVRWAIIALQQGARFTSGAEPTLELGLTGRMIAELEQDVLTLLRERSPDAARLDALVDGSGAVPRVDDVPAGDALLEAARRTLLERLLPALPDELRYETRMIANAMGIAARELAAAPGDPGVGTSPESLEVDLRRRLALANPKRLGD